MAKKNPAMTGMRKIIKEGCKGRRLADELALPRCKRSDVAAGNENGAVMILGCLQSEF